MPTTVYRDPVTLRRVPSVTTVLGILAKPALLAWANRMGLEGKTLREASDPLADVGTDLHELCASLLAGRPTAPLKCSDPVQIDMLTNAFGRFLTWRNLHKIKPIMAETPMVSQHGFGGTLDFYGEIDNEPLIVDFKTSKAVYLEHRVQVATYVHLAREHGHKVNGAIIVRAGRDEGEGFDFVSLRDLEIDACYEFFLRVLWCYKAQQMLDKGDFSGIINELQRG